MVRTGLREIALEDWVFSVNGERLFAKGVNVAPTALDLSAASPDAVRRDIDLAREAGLDLVRVKGHIARPELYDAADERGMLVWQDFPLHGGHARSVRRQAVEQARAAVDVLGHHPSIAVWCGHDTPEHGIVGQQLPTWNRTILDRWVKRALEKADETRPVIAHSGVMPHLPQLEGTDTRLHLGWGHGDERDLPGLAAAMPRLVRFVSEFGSQSVPDGEPLVDTAQWPDLDWQLLDRSSRSRPRQHGAPRQPVQVRVVRRLGARHAALPGHVAAPSHRDAAPPEVPADRRVLPVVAGRPCAARSRPPSSTTNAGRSWPSPASPTRAGR